MPSFTEPTVVATTTLRNPKNSQRKNLKILAKNGTDDSKDEEERQEQLAKEQAYSSAVVLGMVCFLYFFENFETCEAFDERNLKSRNNNKTFLANLRNEFCLCY